MPSLQNIDRDHDMIFMQDGAPPHYATPVVASSMKNFQGGSLAEEGLWNGLLGRVISPHVTFFFGVGLKSKFINDLPQLLKNLNM